MRDEIPARLQNAWWVHPHTGEVIPVHAHAKSVADNPAKFGLKASDIGDVGGGQRMNYFDRKAGSAAQDAITAANKQGWVRVRNVLGRGPVFQVHGNAHEIPKVIGHLEKKGIKLRGPATVDDPGHGYTKTFSGGVEAVKTANLGNVAKAGSGDAEVWHNMDDESARDLLRTRLYARAGLPQEERALLLRRIAMFLGESHYEQNYHALHFPSLSAQLTNFLDRRSDARDVAGRVLPRSQDSAAASAALKQAGKTIGHVPALIHARGVIEQHYYRTAGLSTQNMGGRLLSAMDSYLAGFRAHAENKPEEAEAHVVDMYRELHVKRDPAKRADRLWYMKRPSTEPAPQPG